jgi:hypothetical protein
MCASLRSTQDRVVSREAAARIVVLAASAQHFLIVPVIEVPRRCAAPRAAAFLAPNQWRFAAAGTVIPAPPFPAGWNSSEIVALVPFATCQRKSG